MLKKILFGLTLILVLVLAACAPAATEAPPPEEAPAEEMPAEEMPAEEAPAEEAPAEEMPMVEELTILWAEWPPADYLQQIGNMYEEETGIKVNVIQEPWGSFLDLFTTAMAAKSDAYDMVDRFPGW
jgi:multiple sugar transport system substrate-binding protein